MIATTSKIVLALALTGASATPVPHHKFSMKPRMRTLREEVSGRVAKYQAHARSLRVEIPDGAIKQDSTVDHTSTAFWGYPATLDYTVDVAFSTDSGKTYTEYPVIVDTGSSNLALAVSSCSGCGTGSTTLDVTLQSEECIEVTYGSGAWSGYETATMSIGFLQGSGTNLTDETTMAGITYSDDFFEGSGYNGILGLAYSDLMEGYSSSECSSSSSSSSGGGGGGPPGGPRSAEDKVGYEGAPAVTDATAVGPNGDGSASGGGTPGGVSDGHDDETSTSVTSSSSSSTLPLLDTMYADGLMASDLFTLSFCSNDAAFGIGGIDAGGHTNDISYVDVAETYDMFYGYYLVYLESVAVDGTTITGVTAEDYNWLGGVLVDSGTTLVYLPSAAASAVETKVSAAVEAAGGKSLSNGFFEMMSSVTAEELENFPSVEIRLSGYTLELTPKDYMLHYEQEYYWGIESSSVGIIGNIALQNKMVVFDRENNRLGFADANCGTGANVTVAAENGMESVGLDDTTTDDASTTTTTTKATGATGARSGPSRNVAKLAATGAPPTDDMGATPAAASPALMGAGVLVVAAALVAVLRRRQSASYAPLVESAETAVV